MIIRCLPVTMRSVVSFCVTLLVFHSSVCALELNGTVKGNSGAPLAGAKVELAVGKSNQVTNENGYFDFFETDIKMQVLAEQNRFAIRNGQLELWVGLNEPVEINLFTMNGRLISHSSYEALSAGNHRFPLADHPLAPMVSILQVKKGSSSSQMLYNTTEKSVQFAQRGSTPISHSQSRAAVEVTDTLIISADGYNCIAVPLTTFPESLSVTLDSLKESTTSGITVRNFTGNSRYQLGSVENTFCSNCVLSPMPAQVVEVAYNQYTGPIKDLFSDTATFVELESYTINTRKMIECVVDTATRQLNITNWVPRNLPNVVITGEYKGKRYTMFTIDTLRGSARITLDLPWNYGATRFLSSDGLEMVDLSKVPAESLIVLFDFIPQDEVQTAIKDIAVEWTIVFRDRVMNGSADICRDANVVWRPNRPQDCRYTLGFMINAAQTVSQPKFYEFWMKTPFMTYSGTIDAASVLTRDEYNSYTDKEKVCYDSTLIDSGRYYNKAHRDIVFKKYYSKYWACGMTGGGGLGGGSTLGLNHTKIFEQAWTYNSGAAGALDNDDWYLPEGNTGAYETPWAIYGHEAGHCLGFGHQQSYCVNSKYSHITVGTIVYSWLMANHKTIVTPETMVGRDESWEKEYKKTDSIPSRPRCDAAFEWGGVYGKHTITMPTAGKTSPDWPLYLEAHKQGKGLEFLMSIQ